MLKFGVELSIWSDARGESAINYRHQPSLDGIYHASVFMGMRHTSVDWRFLPFHMGGAELLFCLRDD